MRERHTFGERTKMRSNIEPKKKFFLVYEGKDTERIYFERINQCRDALGIDPLIELVPVFRSYSEEGCSNPQKIVEHVLQQLDEIKNGQITYRRLLDWVMDYLYEKDILTSIKAEDKVIYAELKLICDKNQWAINETVDNIEEVTRQIAVCLTENQGMVELLEFVPTIISHVSITYDENIDKICFIVDRDPQSFKPNQYDFVLDVCAKKGFGFYPTNPNFEFWLLLHFDEVRQLDEEKLLKNIKVNNTRHYAEAELRKLLPGYKKSNYQVDKLIPNMVNTAVANEKQYCEDTVGLKEHLGSRIGILLHEMQGQEIEQVYRADSI